RAWRLRSRIQVLQRVPPHLFDRVEVRKEWPCFHVERVHYPRPEHLKLRLFRAQALVLVNDAPRKRAHFPIFQSPVPFFVCERHDVGWDIVRHPMGKAVPIALKLIEPSIKADEVLSENSRY